jgi:CubicO group peptidase (beta-lactamase class C family)
MLLAALAVGVPALVAGVIVAIAMTEETLHPDAAAIESVSEAPPAPRWAAAVEQARQVARAELSRQNKPGLSVAVGVGGEIVWTEGFGWANLDARTPVTPRSRFRIGHVSKALTSAGVGVLLERNRLHLDEEIQVHVPAFPRKAWPVTLRQLMGHVAGVRHYRDTEWGDKPTAHCERAADGVRVFAADPLRFQPETQYGYSTYGWVLVSAAVEAVAGEPFPAFMASQVFAPLGMVDTATDLANQPMRDRVTSYYRNFSRNLTTDVDYSCFAGAGAFISTSSDLVRFGIAMTRGTLLQPATVHRLQTPQLLRSGDQTEYGLGWMLGTAELAGERVRVVGHASRTIEGASTSFLMFPERELVVAALTNISFGDARSIALGVAEAFARATRSR